MNIENNIKIMKLSPKLITNSQIQNYFQNYWLIFINNSYNSNATFSKLPFNTTHLAAHLGLDNYQAGLLPEDKTAAVRRLKTGNATVAMVGDGVNDAPALATADVAIAMGTAGTDVALETADVALMTDDLTRLPAAIQLARRARTNVRQNIAMSLVSVAVLIFAALVGWLNLTGGVVLNEGTAILIIANGLRMLRHPATEETT